MGEAQKYQVGALCWRRKGHMVEILLITSRETQRWVIPKGWPMKSRTDHGAAKREAYEEAGVDGTISHEPMGQFSYDKMTGAEGASLLVTLFALEVKTQFATWPEKKQRQRQWFSPADAALRVAEPGLKAILRNFRG